MSMPFTPETEEEKAIIAKIRQYHDAAMKCCDEAYAAVFYRLDHATSREWYQKAFDYENNAALLVQEHFPNEQPTRAVLCRSAASIAAVNLQDYETALALVEIGLEANPPEEIAEELRDVQAFAISKQVHLTEISIPVDEHGKPTEPHGVVPPEGPPSESTIPNLGKDELTPFTEQQFSYLLDRASKDKVRLNSVITKVLSENPFLPVHDGFTDPFVMQEWIKPVHSLYPPYPELIPSKESTEETGLGSDLGRSRVQSEGKTLAQVFGELKPDYSGGGIVVPDKVAKVVDNWLERMRGRMMMNLFLGAAEPKREQAQATTEHSNQGNTFLVNSADTFVDAIKAVLSEVEAAASGEGLTGDIVMPGEGVIFQANVLSTPDGLKKLEQRLQAYGVESLVKVSGNAGGFGNKRDLYVAMEAEHIRAARAKRDAEMAEYEARLTIDRKVSLVNALSLAELGVKLSGVYGLVDGEGISQRTLNPVIRELETTVSNQHGKITSIVAKVLVLALKRIHDEFFGEDKDADEPLESIMAKFADERDHNPYTPRLLKKEVAKLWEEAKQALSLVEPLPIYGSNANANAGVTSKRTGRKEHRRSVKQSQNQKQKQNRNKKRGQ